MLSAGEPVGGPKTASTTGRRHGCAATSDLMQSWWKGGDPSAPKAVGMFLVSRGRDSEERRLGGGEKLPGAG